MEDDAAADIQEFVDEAVNSLSAELRRQMSNVEIVIEDKPPAGETLLGLYQGVPLTRRGAFYAGALPDKITIYRMPRVTGEPAARAGSAPPHV